MCVDGSQAAVLLHGALKRGFLAKKGHLKRLRPPATACDRLRPLATVGTPITYFGWSPPARNWWISIHDHETTLVWSLNHTTQLLGRKGAMDEAPHSIYDVRPKLCSGGGLPS